MRNDELAWLLDENWTPTSVTYNGVKVGMSDEDFDQQQAMSYGYESVSDMDKHNHKRDKAHALKYGDKVKGLI